MDRREFLKKGLEGVVIGSILLIGCSESPVEYKVEKINGQIFVFENGQWFQIDNKEKYEVIPDIITVKFKKDIADDLIDDLLKKYNISTLRKNELGFYDLKITEKTDPIEIVKVLLVNPIVEIAHTNCYGKYW